MGAMLLADLIAERRIAEAQARGEFEHLPGAGSPLDLDEDPLVPEEWRLALRVLRNAGVLPPELEVRCEIATLVQRLDDCSEDSALRQGHARLACLQARLEAMRGGRGLGLQPAYHARVVERFGGA